MKASKEVSINAIAAGIYYSSNSNVTAYFRSLER